MSQKIDMTGQRCGYAIVLNEAEKQNGKTMWNCLCDCGNVFVADGYNLRSGNTKSCGCYQKRKNIDRCQKHGLAHSNLYRVYRHIKGRCLNPNEKGYERYGGRGIAICDEWLGDKGFINFYHWSMKNGYKQGLSIDRIDVDGDYKPNNCRWTTMKVQNNNRRNNHRITVNGETKTISEWSDEVRINSSTIIARLRRGWTEKNAIYTPLLR